MLVDEREIPGIKPVEWRECRYVSDDGNDNFLRNGLFALIMDNIEPPFPESGGVIIENCKIWLPSGELLHALSYKGDIVGWRK